MRPASTASSTPEPETGTPLCSGVLSMGSAGQWVASGAGLICNGLIWGVPGRGDPESDLFPSRGLSRVFYLFPVLTETHYSFRN